MIFRYHNFLILFYTASLNSADSDSAHIIIIIYWRHQHLHRAISISLRRRDIIFYCFKQHLKVFSLFILGKRSGSCPAWTEKYGTFQLFVIGVKLYKKIKNFIRDFIKSGVGSIYFINHNNNTMVHFKSLLKHKSRLRHRTFSSVNKQNNTVYHLQNTLNLSAEISVTRRINYIHLYTVVIYRRVFSKYSDTAFTFQIVVIHNAFLNDLVLSINSALFQHFIN